MALTLPDHVNPGDSGHIADTNLIIDALAALDARGGGSTYTPSVLTVAASTASAAVKASATYVCDGTADNVEIQAAIDAVKALGGEVRLTEGTFNLAVALSITGVNSYAGTTTILAGAGMHSTKLACAVNVNGISLSNQASVAIRDVAIMVSGTGSGIVSSRTQPMRRGFWNSQFENIYFTRNGAGVHTGWAMDLGSPFRSTFENLEVYDLHNGFRLYSQDADFNPGDCTFTRCFIEMDTVAGSIGLKLESPVNLGLMNQITFTMVELYDFGPGGTAIQFAGAGLYSTGSPWNFFTGINIENFATLVDVQYGYGNRFDFNYLHALPGGTVFKFGSTTGGNYIRSAGLVEVGDGETLVIVNDAGADPDNPNTIADVYIGVGSGGVANATVSATTRITGTRGYNAGGTLAPALAFQKTPIAGLRLPHGAVPSPLTNGDMWTTTAGLFVRINGVTKTVTLT